MSEEDYAERLPKLRALQGELERFGAFGRAVIAVGTSAGAGIVDRGQVVPLE